MSHRKNVLVKMFHICITNNQPGLPDKCIIPTIFPFNLWKIAFHALLCASIPQLCLHFKRGVSPAFKRTNRLS